MCILAYSWGASIRLHDWLQGRGGTQDNGCPIISLWVMISPHLGEVSTPCHVSGARNKDLAPRERGGVGRILWLKAWTAKRRLACKPFQRRCLFGEVLGQFIQEGRFYFQDRTSQMRVSECPESPLLPRNHCASTTTRPGCLDDFLKGFSFPTISMSQIIM